MTHDFDPEAREEFIEAAKWYEEQRSGLGGEFVAAVEAGIAVMLRDPERFQRIDGECRILRLKRFPYSIYFEHCPTLQHIRVYAVAHRRRRTGYWLSRYDS
jgi:ParE toxin of type II toxin-antitoxin system, parDE